MDLHFGLDKNEQSFYVTVDKEHKAVVTYAIRDGVWYLEHTLVPHELSGKGIGGKLAKYVFDYLREHKIAYKSICTFLVAYEQKQVAK